LRRQLAIIVLASRHGQSMPNPRSSRKRKIMLCANGVPNGIGTDSIFKSSFLPLAFAGATTAGKIFLTAELPRGILARIRAHLSNASEYVGERSRSIGIVAL